MTKNTDINICIVVDYSTIFGILLGEVILSIDEVSKLIVRVEGGLLQKGSLSLEEVHGIESARKFNESNAPDFAVRRLLKTVADSMMGLVVAGHLPAEDAIIHLLGVCESSSMIGT